MPRKFMKNLTQTIDHADFDTTMECLQLQESGYYDQCMCGWNGDHDEEAEYYYWESLGFNE